MSAGFLSMRQMLVAVFMLATCEPKMARAEALGSGLVFLDEIDATIIQDMRYAGKNNFVGRPLPGYGSAQCVVKSRVANALKQVQSELIAKKLSLNMLDCYRPIRAVQAMVQWVSDSKISGDKSYFPRTKKAALINQGYIASRSGHSTGTVVDLTLVDLSVSPDGANALSENGPQNNYRAPNEIDMGTNYDCFDPKSTTFNTEISQQQQQNRAMLVALMNRHGFSNYKREWWHFSFRGASSVAFDFDIPVGRNYRKEPANGLD